MSLSFKQKLEDSIPEYCYGKDRIEVIEKVIDSKPIHDEIYREIEKLLIKMLEEEASDMNIGGYRSRGYVWLRVYGDNVPMEEFGTYSVDEVAAILISLLSDEHKEQLYRDKSVDFAFSVDIPGYDQDFRFRSNIYFERKILVANFRLIKQELFKIKKLGFPAKIIQRLDWEHEKSGLIMVTGITGAGKSSTLDSIIDMNNQKNRSHITIIGNPVEYLHKSRQSLVTHREVGTDVPSFHKGTIQALRQDPDIIVVGEMRDAKTISTVLEVTDSGHKVFTTLHTHSAVESISRIIAQFPPNEQERIRYRLADTLQIVISQKLVPNRRHTLTLAKEILSMNESIKAAIRNNHLGEIFQMLTEGRKEGMFTMQQNLHFLVRKGIITPQTAMDYANNKKIMKQLLKYT